MTRACSVEPSQRATSAVEPVPPATQRSPGAASYPTPQRAPRERGVTVVPSLDQMPSAPTRKAPPPLAGTTS